MREFLGDNEERTLSKEDINSLSWPNDLIQFQLPGHQECSKLR